MTVRGIAGRIAGVNGRRWYRIAAAVAALAGLAALLLSASGQLFDGGGSGLVHP